MVARSFNESEHRPRKTERLVCHEVELVERVTRKVLGQDPVAVGRILEMTEALLARDVARVPESAVERARWIARAALDASLKLRREQADPQWHLAATWTWNSRVLPLKPLIRCVIWREVRNANDVDDFEQEVYLRLWQHAAELPDDDGSLRAYAAQTARHVVYDAARRRKANAARRARPLSGTAAPLEDLVAHGGVDCGRETRESTQQLLDALSTKLEQCTLKHSVTLRVAIVYAVLTISGKSEAEIHQVIESRFNLGVGARRQALYRARLLLKQLLKELGHEN